MYMCDFWFSEIKLVSRNQTNCRDAAISSGARHAAVVYYMCGIDDICAWFYVNTHYIKINSPSGVKFRLFLLNCILDNWNAIL